MKINCTKKLSLNNFGKSYLLIKTPTSIITNTNYDEILILDENLKQKKTIKFPTKNLLIQNFYQKINSDEVVFELDDENFMLYLNLNDSVFKIIPAPQLYISSPYTWNNHKVLAPAEYEKWILEIDTKSLTTNLKPFGERSTVVPDLTKKIELIEQYKPSNCISEKQLFIVTDYYETKIIKVINFQGEQIQTISIANELDKELDGKTDPIIHAEKIPHEIRYQDGWFIILWEKKIVVVSPRDNRTTIYPRGTFMFARARFIKTTDKTADFVLLTCDESNEEPRELQLYKVEDN